MALSSASLPRRLRDAAMKIIVLDGFTLNPGDLSWDELKSSGPCDIYDRTPPEEVVRRGADADVVLTKKTPVTREWVHALSKTKENGRVSAGTAKSGTGSAALRGQTDSDTSHSEA